jgi:tRNA(fMet)-specific endonuclease VapC
VLPFDLFAAEIFGQIKSNLGRKGRLIGDADLQITAIAMARDLTVATHNNEHMSRVEGLRIEDWISSS